MSVDVYALISGIIAIATGIWVTYYGIALIRNLRGSGDKALKQHADDPGRGGWRRASADDPSVRSSEGTTLVSFVYVPKTMRQVKLIGWVTMPFGLLFIVLGLALTVAALTGGVEPA